MAAAGSMNQRIKDLIFPCCIYDHEVNSMEGTNEKIKTNQSRNPFSIIVVMIRNLLSSSLVYFAGVALNPNQRFLVRTAARRTILHGLSRHFPNSCVTRARWGKSRSKGNSTRRCTTSRAPAAVSGASRWAGPVAIRSSCGRRELRWSSTRRWISAICFWVIIVIIAIVLPSEVWSEMELDDEEGAESRFRRRFRFPITS